MKSTNGQRNNRLTLSCTPPRVKFLRKYDIPLEKYPINHRLPHVLKHAL